MNIAVAYEVTSSIKSAIENSDNLLNTTASLEMRVQRHALVIVADYDTGSRGFRGPGPKLASTHNDALNIYLMLLKKKYELCNIRILCKGITRTGINNPIRKDLLASLEWLVANTQNGDHRYFHFSGHVMLCETIKGESKVSLVVELPLTTKDSISEPNPEVVEWNSQAIKAQEVNKVRLKQYQEGLIRADYSFFGY
ncbi:unnamed protein product [Rhizoctonia solani]|uniref:Peptidase C14 caspase domain-containing protein n=1 Tax=Rhizoctonia solani TaxID=456999 RepID=A0A8H2WUD4_9AGAM|nr:unnamed protein product [Rhizoctonia solani]